VATHDWGALGEYRPIDGFRDGGNAVAVGIALGYADINAGGHEDDASTPVYRQRRSGVATRFAAGRGPVLAPFGAGLTPLVTVIASYDHADRGAGDGFDWNNNGGGVELSAMNIVSLRAGRYADDWTYGWGLALPFGALGGASYDEARWPITDGFDPLHRRQFAVWLDPFAVWRARRTREDCMPRTETRVSFVAIAIAAFAFAQYAFAQGTGRSMDIDISARSAALGGASTALPWGDLNHWANPALLGYVDGIRYAHQRTQLVPGSRPTCSSPPTTCRRAPAGSACCSRASHSTRAASTSITA
jgi:hypothetical protein